MTTFFYEPPQAFNSEELSKKVEEKKGVSDEIEAKNYVAHPPLIRTIRFYYNSEFYCVFHSIIL